MGEPTAKNPTQSTALLLGILLTCVAVVAHRYLPERRLTLDSARPGANFYLVPIGANPPPRLEWVDQARLHYTCRFAPDAAADQDCSFMYQLYATQADQGIDLSDYRTLKLAIRYAGDARYVRIAIRNFDPRFSRIEDSNSSKFNYVNLHPEDLAAPVAIKLSEFTVPEWWVGQYDLPRDVGQPDLGNAILFSVDLLGNLPGSSHDIQIDQIEFAGDWISAEHWYLGIMGIWMILGIAYAVTQWLRLHRTQRAQRRKIDELEHEKDKFEKLSTLDALTNVLNRHGIERFVENLRKTRTPASVIVIDLDHFKKVNDLRGHYGGDRVLRQVGEILRKHTRNTDGLGRWGGEEFVLVCPGAHLAKAADLAEKLRHKIKETDFIPDDPLPITASFGVAASSPEQSFEDAFRQADQALYLAKSRGRNCVVAANEDQMHRMTGARKGTWALISGRFRIHK